MYICGCNLMVFQPSDVISGFFPTYNEIMTTEQLDCVINHYKNKAIRAFNDDDTFSCNRMITIVHDLEVNYDDYLDYEYGNDFMELYFDSILPKAEPKRHPLFRDIDPYSDVDTNEVIEWMEDLDEDFDDDFDFF